MDYKYDYLVFIGRFQPLHNGHKHVIETALKHSETVIIVIGSSGASRTLRNPFTFQERKEMIMDCFQHIATYRLMFVEAADYPYNEERWIREIQEGVDEVLNCDPVIPNARVGLIGHRKDHTSYCLSLFPTWGSEDVQAMPQGQHRMFNATDVREAYFDGDIHFEKIMKNDKFALAVEGVPLPVMEFLREWKDSEHFNKLKAERDFVSDYKKQWAVAPYPVTFVCTDAVVVQSGHVLVVRRGANPGKNLLALPGGFLNQEETLLECSIRELKEETKIKVPVAVLKGSLVREKTFDAPHRSSRGRTLTTAFLFHLSAQPELPKVKGADDAKDAFWIPLKDLKREDFFEDHYDIIDNLVSTL